MDVDAENGNVGDSVADSEMNGNPSNTEEGNCIENGNCHISDQKLSRSEEVNSTENHHGYISNKDLSKSEVGNSPENGNCHVLDNESQVEEGNCTEKDNCPNSVTEMECDDSAETGNCPVSDRKLSQTGHSECTDEYGNCSPMDGNCSPMDCGSDRRSTGFEDLGSETGSLFDEVRLP